MQRMIGAVKFSEIEVRKHARDGPGIGGKTATHQRLIQLRDQPRGRAEGA
jgi:hypothetical protein